MVVVEDVVIARLAASASRRIHHVHTRNVETDARVRLWNTLVRVVAISAVVSILRPRIDRCLWLGICYRGVWTLEAVSALIHHGGQPEQSARHTGNRIAIALCIRGRASFGIPTEAWVPPALSRDLASHESGNVSRWETKSSLRVGSGGRPDVVVEWCRVDFVQKRVQVNINLCGCSDNQVAVLSKVEILICGRKVV